MTNNAEIIILIHGLWMHGLVMLPQQHWLRAERFAVSRVSYPSWRGGLADNVRLLSKVLGKTSGSVIHLVAHSLGGLVALKLLEQNADPRIRRVVLLGTPYAACHCGRYLAATPALSGLLGRTFTDWFRLPRPALPPEVEIGIIAGTRSRSFGRLIPGLALPNDGLVAVDETRIATAKDSIALKVSHSGMLLSRTCAGQIAHFLRTGNFIHA